MILILTNSDDATADFLCERLLRESITHFRFDTDTDLTQVTVGYNSTGPFLQVSQHRLSPSDIRHVWYRRPKPIMPTIDAPDAERWQVAYEWSEAIEGFLAHIPLKRWINHPSRNACASHKLEQLSKAASYGLQIPDSIVTQSGNVLQAFWSQHKGDVIVKPIACGYIEREQPHEDTQIYTNRLSESDIAAIGELPNCPTFFQHLISKAIDVRIVVVDDEVTAIGIRGTDSDGKQRVDIRRNNMSDVRYESMDLPTNISNSLKALLQSYELRFAAIDMAVDNFGNWVFFEINPNGQWAWLDLAGASDIAASFVRAFSSEPDRG